MAPFAQAGGEELFFLESRGATEPGLYVSAGIHGDEPAGTEALIEWAEAETPFLRHQSALIFPCLNPWGLLWNNRFDSKGKDLNRQYHSSRIPQITAHKRILTGHSFAVALTLHEDYDARGVYVYEIARRKPFLGEQVLAAAARHLPIEPRSRIEGRRCHKGVIRRDITPEAMTLHPEALLLHFHHSLRTLTLETPSECSIHDRVESQIAVLRKIQSLLTSGNLT